MARRTTPTSAAMEAATLRPAATSTMSMAQAASAGAGAWSGSIDGKASPVKSKPMVV